MKAIPLVLILLAFGLNLSAQQDEKQAVKDVILSAYIDGIHNRGGIEKVEAGFHPGFEMLGVNDGLLTRFPIYSWISTLKKRMASGEAQAAKITAEFPLVDVAGHAAIARVELYRDGKHIFTDYMNLYKFDDGWKIVAKTYYRIPEDGQ